MHTLTSVLYTAYHYLHHLQSIFLQYLLYIHSCLPSLPWRTAYTSIPHTPEPMSYVQPQHPRRAAKAFLSPTAELSHQQYSTRIMAHKFNKDTTTEADWQALGISDLEPFGMLSLAQTLPAPLTSWSHYCKGKTPV